MPIKAEVNLVKHMQATRKQILLLCTKDGVDWEQHKRYLGHLQSLVDQASRPLGSLKEPEVKLPEHPSTEVVDLQS